jgi:hypothetical protein
VGCTKTCVFVRVSRRLPFQPIAKPAPAERERVAVSARERPIELARPARVELVDSARLARGQDLAERETRRAFRHSRVPRCGASGGALPSARDRFA